MIIGEPKWVPVSGVPCVAGVAAAQDATVARAAAARDGIAFEELRLRQALLMQVLQLLLAHRPPDAASSLAALLAEPEDSLLCSAVQCKCSGAYCDLNNF